MSLPVPAAGAVLSAELLSKAQKAAILLGLLDEQAAGPVFEGLDEDSVRRFVRAMAGLGRVAPEVVRAVVAEFLAEVESAGRAVRGGADAARAIVGRHLDEATTARLLDDVDAAAGRNVWARLAGVEPAELAGFLAREHPQTAALILARLAPDHAGKVISHIDLEAARPVVEAIRRIADVPPRTVDAIAESVGRTLLAGRGGGAAMRPEQRLGAIFDYASGEFRDGIMLFLETSDPDFAGRTRRSMFTFPDIETRLRRQDVSAVVRAVDQKILVTALAGAERNAPGAKKFILSNISSRMAEAIEEEIGETGAVRGGDAEAAQNEVIRAIRQLERSGEIALVREEEA